MLGFVSGFRVSGVGVVGLEGSWDGTVDGQNPA